MEIIYLIIAFFLAITVHEFMHAWTANYLGDQTAAREGRVSLNPIRHIDPFGTVILPALLILAGLPALGYAKPVPINPNNFSNPRLGSALTAVAGPMSNFILAGLSAILYRNLPAFAYNEVFLYIAFINIALMLFNLIPIPPLDGSKVLAYVFPGVTSPKAEMIGPIVLLVLIYLGFFRFLVPVISFVLSNVFGLGLNPF